MGKIDADTLQAVRDAYENTDMSIAQICRDFGVSRSWFSAKRKDYGWVRPDHDTPLEPSEEQVIVGEGDPPFPEADDDELGKVQAELAEARQRLRELEPETYQWITDLDSAAEVLAPQMEELVEARWVEYIEERDARNLPRPERMTPEWAERTRTGILNEAVASLTASATNEGPATRTQAWQKPDGTVVKIPYDISIGNYAVSATAYEDGFRAKGFTKLTPQPCIRESCWAPGSGAQVHVGGNLWGGADFDGYCGETHRALDESMGQTVTRATTTGTFDIGSG